MSKDSGWMEEIQKDYGSLENYVIERKNGGAEPLFFGYAPFKYLLEKELLREYDVIRTNLQKGFKDGHYEITAKGELKGIEAAQGLYSGKKGIHSPEKILNLNHADNGWTVNFFVQARIICYSE